MIKFILKSVIRDFSQYLLATIGLIIGITSLISMGYLGIIGKIKLYKEINNQGVNIVYVYPNFAQKSAVRKNFSGEYHSIKEEEIEYISSMPFETETTIAVNYFTGSAKYGRNFINNVEIVASEGDYLKFFNYELLEASQEVGNKGCYIGYTVFKELFNENLNALGKYINIAGNFIKVRGIIKEKGASSSGRDRDNIIIVSLNLFKNKFHNVDYFNALYVKPVQVDFLHTLKNSVKYLLKKINNNFVFPLKDFQYSVKSMDYYVKKQEKVGSMMVYTTFLVSSITLIVGGIGVMAIMLILSIKETREIGIKRALGATKFYIFMEYLIKSFSIAIMGSFLGLIFGFIAYLIINKIYKINALFPVGYAVIGVVSVFLITIIFGLYPAAKASSIEPSTALHHQ